MTSLFSLDGEVAVVTGALGRLGPVWMEALLDEGARVLGLDLPGRPQGEAVQALSARHAGSLLLAEADVRERGSLERADTLCEARLGPPTILVNNAGIDAPPSAAPATWRIEDIPEEVTRGLLEVNVVGAFLAAQVFGAGMCRRGRGSIVNIGSLYASVSPNAALYEHIPVDPPFLKPPAYGASKAALVSLTRYLATHWAPRGVRVNALSPGGVLGAQDETFKAAFRARVPMGRMAEPQDLKGPLVFLASRASAYVTGIELLADGGYTAW